VEDGLGGLGEAGPVGGDDDEGGLAVGDLAGEGGAREIGEVGMMVDREDFL
jgi:hypothetical protein